MSKYPNPHLNKSCRGLIHFLLWQVGYYKDPCSTTSVPEDFVYPIAKEQVCLEKSYVQWINHSTFLIHTEGKNFLLDPIWNKRCSPFPFLGPKRFHNPPIELNELPSIDYVIISHNHYDHLDYKTVCQLTALQKQITWIVPKGVKKWFKKHAPKAFVVELSWWESMLVDNPANSEQVKFTAVPAQHFSGRGIFDRNKTLWMGCVVEFMQNQKTIKNFYFVGDTGYNPFDFKKIGKEFGPIDLSIIPIGAYVPRKFMSPVHIDPSEAVVIHQEVRSRLSVGSHFGTFRLSNESMDHPPYDLFLALKEAKVSHEHFRVLKPGQIINW